MLNGEMLPSSRKERLDRILAEDDVCWHGEDLRWQG